MMSRRKKSDLYYDAWEKWGAMSQLDMVIEEMAELTQAILKARRDGGWVSTDVVKEYVDVKICLEQLGEKLVVYGFQTMIATSKEEKLKRLENLVYHDV